MIVVDANILTFYLVEGNRTADANALRLRDPEWIVPAFWCVEFQNIVWKYVRFGGLPMGQALELLDHAITLFSPNEMTPPPDLVLRDALSWKITAYDAQYVSLARQLGIFCVTEDGPVQQACPTLAVSLDKFLRGPTTRTMVRESRTAYRTRRKR